jgi:hypothetical protein
MEVRELRYRRSIFWPLLLIALGVIFLLNSLGVIQGDVWDLFIRLWPLLFILGGLDHLFRGEGWVWGIISLGLGTVFLLSNFGYLPWDAFSLLLRLWPLLLIALGLDLVFKGRSALATLVGVLLSLAIIGGITWYALTNSNALSVNVEKISQPLGEAQRASVRLANPVGRLIVSSGAEPSQLISGSATLARDQSLDTRYSIDNGLASYSLTSSSVVFVPWNGGFNPPVWDVNLTEAAPINLNLDTGVGEQTVDLRGLDLEEVTISVAVGQLELTLSADDQFSGEVSNPVGSIVIYVPAGALVEFRTDTAISTREIPVGYRVDGNLVYSPGADASNARIRLTVEKPIGRLSIRTLP